MDMEARRLKIQEHRATREHIAEKNLFIMLDRSQIDLMAREFSDTMYIPGPWGGEGAIHTPGEEGTATMPEEKGTMHMPTTCDMYMSLVKGFCSCNLLKTMCIFAWCVKRLNLKGIKMFEWKRIMEAEICRLWVWRPLSRFQMKTVTYADDNHKCSDITLEMHGSCYQYKRANLTRRAVENDPLAQWLALAVAS